MVSTKSTTLLSLEGLAHPCDVTAAPRTRTHLDLKDCGCPARVPITDSMMCDYSCSYRPLVPAAERSSQVVA